MPLISTPTSCFSPYIPLCCFLLKLSKPFCCITQVTLPREKKKKSKCLKIAHLMVPSNSDCQGNSASFLFSLHWWSGVSSMPFALKFTKKISYFLHVNLSIFFFFLATLWHIEFSTQGSDLSCSCKLQHSCSNARSFNPLCWARDRTCRFCCTLVGTL